MSRIRLNRCSNFTWRHITYNNPPFAWPTDQPNWGCVESERFRQDCRWSLLIDCERLLPCCYLSSSSHKHLLLLLLSLLFALIVSPGSRRVDPQVYSLSVRATCWLGRPTDWLTLVEVSPLTSRPINLNGAPVSQLASRWVDYRLSCARMQPALGLDVKCEASGHNVPPLYHSTLAATSSLTDTWYLRPTVQAERVVIKRGWPQPQQWPSPTS